MAADGLCECGGHLSLGAGPMLHCRATYTLRWHLLDSVGINNQKEDITEGKESIDGLSKSGRGQIWDRYDQDTLQSWA